jgi:hypothetical protein
MRRRPAAHRRGGAACGLLLLLSAVPAAAQSLSQRGFVEARTTAYPQATPEDATRLVADFVVREEASWRPVPWLTLAGGFDARADTHGRAERSWTVDWSDRGARRPVLSVRRLSAAARRHGLTLEVGKQFVRWGKADVLNPTDRFAPRDFMEVVQNDFLGITAARLIWERGPDTLDAVWAPRFTPSRVPLLGDRWGGLPGGLSLAGLAAARVGLVDVGPTYPSRSQAGIRWNHVAQGYEFSLSAYDGVNHLPRFDARTIQLPVPLLPGGGSGSGAAAILELGRRYPRMRMVGGDAAVPLRWLTLKAEAAWFTSPDRDADDYGIYVLQAERQTGEWFLVAGYAGEVVGRHRETAAFATGGEGFALDRGLTDTFLGRASYTIDVNRSLAFEGAVRRSARGGWVKAEYSQAVGQHWRVTTRVNAIGGRASDFLGQYRRNSSLDLVLRFSF